MFDREKGTGQVFSPWNNKATFLEMFDNKFEILIWYWHNLRYRRVLLLAKERRAFPEIMQSFRHSILSTTQ